MPFHRKIEDLLFPPRCACCDTLLAKDEWEGGFCGECRENVVRVSKTHCMRCGRPIASPTEEYCADCRERGERGGRKTFLQNKGVYLYRGDMKTAMYRFKYGNRREYAKAYARDAARMYGEWIRGQAFSLIVPVPMYKRKENLRGYNQAEVFAKELGKATGLPVRSDLVVRIRDTRPLKTLNAAERKNNLKNAFKIRRIGVKLNRILVVDDIYTTGSTLEGVAGALLDGGAHLVCGLSVCIGNGC